ncbi:MAG: T9SS type A sorting domain-containing protein [Sphingobacteriales bacterium]|nr:MAG: T9SS type A sorting domain-containing protein [Sphingobacteriales bacterium]
MFAAITGEDPGGIWTHDGNVYTYTVTATAPCTGTDQSTVTITEQPQPDAGMDGTLKICAGSTVTTSQLFNSLKGTPTPGGTWLPTLAGAGSYTYTVAATSPCTVDATAQVVVTEQAQPNAGTDGAITVCTGTTPTNEQLFAALTGADASGTWTHDGNVYTYTVIATTPCTESDESKVTVTFDPLPTASAGGNATICANGSKQISGATASNGTILWTGNGAGSIAGETSLTPTYTAAAGDAGKTVTLTMTVTSNNTCGSATATATYTIAVTPLPSVSPLSDVTISYPANATFSTTIAGTTTSSADWKEKIGLAAYTLLGNVAPYSISTLPNNVSTSPTASELTITSPAVSWSGRNYQVNVDGCGITASSSASLTVNAAPLCLTYDGLMFGVTNSSKCYVDNGGKIRIILTVVGSPAGNLSTATVKVSVGNISNATATYVPAANGAPPYFYYDWTVPCPAMANTANSETYDVSWMIGGNYTGAGCSETQALITLSAPSADFTTGGGYIFNNMSKGTLGIARGEITSKNNYGFNLKWGNNLKNLQGNFNTIIRQGGKQYQVKTNKPTYLLTKARPDLNYLGSNGKTVTPYEAVMVYENAVYKNLTTGESQGGGPNSIVYLRVIDMGEPNTAGTSRIDQISILYKLNNVVIYSSEAYTVTNDPSVIKLMDIVKGNIQVHVAGAKGANQRSVDPVITSIAPESFNLKVLPNPSSSYFTVNITANSTEKMQVRVMDIMGRNIETLTNMAPNQSIRLGMQYRLGLYFVELTQGTKKQQVKLIKQ